jgi:hypothetical protein
MRKGEIAEFMDFADACRLRDRPFRDDPVSPPPFSVQEVTLPMVYIVRRLDPILGLPILDDCFIWLLSEKWIRVRLLIDTGASVTTIPYRQDQRRQSGADCGGLLFP